MVKLWNDNERRAVEEQLFTSIIGDPAGVKQQLHELIEKTDADEIMDHTKIFDRKARLRSYENLAQAAVN
ncbi:alkanesulfonate monooxygenase SsuD/methylene tetrahydromethanopterin reductase-like flavin-dependent oxidoreductase (luciferase family) [Peribacillus frigoritolerans]